jgi:hypothetical protein
MQGTTACRFEDNITCIDYLYSRYTTQLEGLTFLPTVSCPRNDTSFFSQLVQRSCFDETIQGSGQIGTWWYVEDSPCDR